MAVENTCCHGKALPARSSLSWLGISYGRHAGDFGTSLNRLYVSTLNDKDFHQVTLTRMCRP